MTGIDPRVIKFAVALVIAGVVIELVSRVNSGAAWAVAGVVILYLLINNRLLTSYLNTGANSLTQGLS